MDKLVDISAEEDDVDVVLDDENEEFSDEVGYPEG